MPTQCGGMEIKMKQQKNYPYNKVTEISSIKNMMELAVTEAGDKPAFKYKDNNKSIKTVTYREFMNDTIYLGTALSSIGAGSSHIAVIGENSYNWLCVYLTVLKSSGVFVPVDKELPLDDIIHVLDNSDSEVLFYSKRYEKYIPELIDALPKIKYFIGFSAENNSDKCLSYKDFILEGRKLYESGDTSYSSVETNLSELRMIVYTSGTTGMSKGVMLSEDNLVSMVYYGPGVCSVNTVCLSVLPYHHTYEAVAGILVSLHSHACICINENMKAVLKNLQLYKPDYIFVVPAFVELFYKKIISNAKNSGKDKLLMTMIKLSNALRAVGIDLRRKMFSSIHEAFGGNLVKILCGGAPLRAELGDFFEAIGIKLINGYGITECSPLISGNRDYFNDCSTVGVPIECLEVRFENMTPEGDGEICVKGRTVMMGYYKNEELTKEVLKDGWFKTGDYGRMNDKGQIIVTGRKKNLIVLKNGKNVFPEEIEGYILKIPYVQETVVRGLIDENGSESGLIAEIFLNEDEVKKLSDINIEATLKKDIAKVCAELPIYKHVSQIKICDTPFEKTTTNKIKR